MAFALKVIEGHASPNYCTIGEDRIVIGRERSCNVVIDFPGVSRRHAGLTARGEICSIEDLGSRNGTFVNQQRIDGRVKLNHNDEIRFGGADARFLNPADAPAATGGSAPATGVDLQANEGPDAGQVDIHEESTATITGEMAGTPSTAEAQIVKISDGIAYINHDIEDALRGGIIYPMDIPLEISNCLGFTQAERIDTLVKDAIAASAGQDRIRQSEDVGRAMQALKDFMLYSGRASLLAYGSYSEVLKASYKLLPGDIVAYWKKGKVVHVAVVTGADSRGYALVNCHNTDRYRVPWDLGWSDSRIRFYLLRAHY